MEPSEVSSSTGACTSITASPQPHREQDRQRIDHGPVYRRVPGLGSAADQGGQEPEGGPAEDVDEVGLGVGGGFTMVSSRGGDGGKCNPRAARD
jgi:hypothetical protein